MKPRRNWVLVADGGQAIIVKYPRKSERLPADVVHDGGEKRLGEIMADKPGRGFASTGARRSAMEYRSDPVRDREALFAVRLAGELAQALANREFDSLILVAEPRMLGLLREALPDQLQRAVVLEVAKDMVKMPRSDRMKALASLDVPGLSLPERVTPRH